ncbi:RAD52 motif-containing protein 1 isoform X2 [Channa argus]|uniref:RAD52 motif-containing protein 1 isoform X2 n=1 Tax=Channa argus TaxID=215402 RepID=UPI003521FD02
MEVDILEFVVPVDNSKTLFVWDIQPSLPEDQIYDRLVGLFSSFGPLYLVKLSSNALLHPPGFSALIKFYSAAQALKAQRFTDGHSLFQSSPLKVRLSSKQTPHFLSHSRPLSHTRCLELANYCLGFNGWTSDIITLKELPDKEEVGGSKDEECGGERWGRLRFGCLLQLSFPHHGQMTRGAAVVEDSFTCTENGKVMVELKQTPDQFIPEEIEGVIQVNEFSWSEFPPDEDDYEEWDLTVS